MTVVEMIEWLKTQDSGATVQVVIRDEGMWADAVSIVDFDPEEHADYIDLRGNPWSKGKPYENKRTLLLGVD